MIRPVLRKQELKRLPFQRRPVAEPGTKLVFQMASGATVAPDHPYTSGDVWWRGPRFVYVVDVRPHSTTFECALPCAGDRLHFEATIGFTWNVHDPVVVVNELIEDAAAECRAHLIQKMRPISRRYAALDSEAAERALLLELGHTAMQLERGLRISGLTVELRIDSQQASIAADLEISTLRQQLAEAEERGRARINQIGQDSTLGLHKERADFFAAILAGGGTAMAGNLLAQDPTKAAEAANFMVSLWQQDQEIAIRAMKVILDSDQVRVGEIDGAVMAAVDRFTALVSQAGGKLAPDALTQGPAIQTAAISEEPASTPEATKADGEAGQ